MMMIFAHSICLLERKHKPTQFLRISMKTLIFITSLLFRHGFQQKICRPSTESFEHIQWNECEPSLDSSSWYGVTKNKMNFKEASEICTRYGGSLLVVPNEFVDRCAYNTLSFNQAFDELVIYSGHLTPYYGWEWCPYYWSEGNECVQDFSYYGYPDNWFKTNETIPGDCMGGYLSHGNIITFSDNYGWIRVPCEDLKQNMSRALCRINCFEEPLPFDNSTTPETVTTPESIITTTANNTIL